MLLQEDVTSRNPITRNRFLAISGATLTSLATGAWFAQEAQACSVPNGCHGYCQCSCCSGSSCCGGCTAVTTACESGGQCWYTCAYWGSTLYKFRCCDWRKNGSNCICRGTIGPC